MRHVKYVAAARREFLAQARYYEEQEPGLGARFVRAVEDATIRASNFPFAGSRATQNTRRVLLANFPMAVIYRPESDGIVVFALAHHARRPDYWRMRVQEL